MIFNFKQNRGGLKRKVTPSLFFRPLVKQLMVCKVSAKSKDNEDEQPVDKVLENSKAKKKRTAGIRTPLVLTKEQEQIVIGGLLGDMHVEFRGLNSRLKFRHGEKQREYALWKYQQLKNLIPSEPKIAVEKSRGDDKDKTYKVIWFNSYTNSAFNVYRDLWYNSEGVKILPPNIEEYLTPLSLFVLFYDDGSAIATSKGFKLALQNFSESELKLFCDALSNKFGIKAGFTDKRINSEGNDRWSLYLKAEDGTKLYNLISPIIKEANLETMAYKTIRHNELTNEE